MLHANRIIPKTATGCKGIPRQPERCPVSDPSKQVRFSWDLPIELLLLTNGEESGNEKGIYPGRDPRGNTLRFSKE
jgi:hypothetical protein